MKIRNNSASEFKLPTGHVLLPKQDTMLPKGVLNHPDNAPYIGSLKRSGRISVAPEKTEQPIKKPKPRTREWLALATRAELKREALKLFGVDIDDDAASDDGLREKLCELMFPEKSEEVSDGVQLPELESDG